MTPLQTLEFAVRHTAHKSSKAIAAIAMTDPSNLHSCLSGKRALPDHIAQRVGCAVGLKVTVHQEEMQASIASDTVITLEVKLGELDLLGQFLQTLAKGKTYNWRLPEQQTEPAAGEVCACVAANIGDSYMLALLVAKTTEEAYQCFDKDLAPILGSLKLPCTPDQFVFSGSDATWLRTKAGLINRQELDRIFSKAVLPSIAEWAQLLIEHTTRASRQRLWDRHCISVGEAGTKKRLPGGAVSSPSPPTLPPLAARA